MKYLIIILVIIAIVLVIYNQFGKKNQENKNSQAKINIESSGTQTELPTPYSGTHYKIQSENYDRFIFVKKTSTNYLVGMIKEHGELLKSEEIKEHSFWIGKSGDRHVIKVGESVDFYNYHNLVGWLTGYEQKPGIPEYSSIGFSKNKSDSQQDYVFYLDPNIEYGDTEVGAFENGKSFFVYLPAAYEEFGNLTITNDVQVSIGELVGFLSENGFDISSIDSLEYVEHRIKMNE
jgi:hypothetical protein